MDRLVCVGAVLLTCGLQVSRTASFSKEFLSAGQEQTRSMEPSSELELKIGGRGMDIGKTLCENYHEWSDWSTCSRKCEQTRVRRCANHDKCGRTWVKEKRTCHRQRGSCYPLSYKVIGIQKRTRMIEELLYDLLYHPWTAWGRCTRSCKQQRTRQCKYKPVCVDSYIQEERRCTVKGSKCENRFSIRPVPPSVQGTFDVSLINSTIFSALATGQSSNHSGLILTKVENGSSEEWTVVKTEEMPGETLERLVDGNKRRMSAGGTFWRKKRKEARRKEARRNKTRSKEKRRRNKMGELESAQNNCGFRPNKVQTGSYKVVGGQEVRKNSWPWQVAIMTKQHEQYCGGTLIAPRWVLTAAHCVRKNGTKRRIIVRVGEHNMEDFDIHQQDIRPSKDFPHPDFDYHTITNDIALIKLHHQPSVFTKSGFACLPEANFEPSKDQLCSIVGWGKLKSTHLFGSSALREAKVPVVKHKKCQRVFRYTITPDQVCAGYKRGGIDSCAGDSGGPLLCLDKSNRYTVHGVTSYGEGCGMRGKYGIYSKVTSYLPWIQKTIKENSK